jgi:hypothetical protein
MDREIREWVEQKRKIPMLKGFLPTMIMKALNIKDKQKVIDECMKLVDEGLLKAKYEALCPKCCRKVKVMDKPENTVINCIYCDDVEDYEVDKSELLISFEICR